MIREQQAKPANSSYLKIRAYPHNLDLFITHSGERDPLVTDPQSRVHDTYVRLYLDYGSVRVVEAGCLMQFIPQME